MLEEEKKTYPELDEIKPILVGFIKRVAGTENKTPEEVQILPEMISTLINFVKYC